MNLNTLYITENDTVPEQKHFELIFLFDKDDKVYEYGLQLEGGMHIEDFRELMLLFAKVIKHREPEECMEEG